jgi:nitroreductase
VSLAELALARRTHKAFGPEPVAAETVLELLDVARFAPNHHLTQPWRFRVLGLETLAALKECAGPGEAAKLDRAPTLVVASAALGGEVVQDEEDVCATAAAIMLVLLAATERGLASYWRTPGVLRTARGRETVGVPAGERVLGLLHFGAPEREPAPRERKTAESYVEVLP